MNKDNTCNSNKKVLIVGSSKLPIPAVNGGAVPNLIESIIKINDNKKKVNITCLSCYTKEAEKESKKYKSTSFVWVNTPKIIDFLDNIIYIIFKKIFHISRLLSLSYFFHIIWFTLMVAKQLNKNDYEYVIFENSLPVLHSLRLYGNSKKYSGKYYFHIHTVPRHYYFNKKILSNSSSIICISNYVKNEIIKKTGIQDKKFSILYNSIDIEKFKPLPKNQINGIKEKYRIPNNKKIVLFAGRLCKDKGIDRVIEAQKALNDDFILLIVGSNFYNTSIKSDFEKKLVDSSKEIIDRVIFTGYLNYEDMPYIYNCADVVVLPSMWDEPAGMTIIESMACRKPVITTISGGIPEYTGEDACILLERNNDISSNIALNVKKIIADEKYTVKLSQNALERTQKFNLNYYYDSFLTILGVK